jgi:hypothetical protein
MPDMSAFDNANTKKKRKSSIEIMFEDLDVNDPDRAAAARQALADRMYTAPAISKVFAGWGYRISPDLVNNWRRAADL